jgi:hypothetical protein
MKHHEIHHGMALKDAVRSWEALGGSVVKKKGTGELIFRHEAMERSLKFNGRRKDAPRKLTAMLMKLAELSKVEK